jgi:group I intron endonuclease
MEKHSGIYQILCKATGERYIGSSGNIQARIREHIYDLRHLIHINYMLMASWVRNGEETFDFSVLEIVNDTSLLFEREQYWLDQLKPELNIATSADRSAYGLKRSQETKDKIRIAAIKRHANMSESKKKYVIENIKKGRQEWWNSLTEVEQQEHIRKISNPHSEETKKILAEKSRNNNVHYWRGKKRSEETVAKLRIKKQEDWDKTKTEREEEKRRKRAELEAEIEQRKINKAERMRRARLGKKASEETREKNRKVALSQQQDPEYRKKHQAGVIAAMKDPEVLRRLSESHKGKKLSEEQKEKIRLSQKGKPKPEEVKKKMSEAQKERWRRKKESSS